MGKDPRLFRPMNGHTHILSTLTCPLSLGCVSVVLYILFSFSACGSSKGDALRSDIDSVDFASLTTGVNTLISDSGVTKYKLEAPVWYTYDKPQRKWYFPEGLHVEQFDTTFTVQASVRADTAYYFEDDKLWHLIGHVHVMSREGQNFYSNSLFWDQNTEEVYSHEYVKIIKSEGQLLEGQFGFRSNQNMTRYQIFSSSGHIDVEDRPLAPSDTLATGSPRTSHTSDTDSISHP